MFCNALIMKTVLCQTGVTKSLELAIEMIRLAEVKWSQININMITNLNPQIGQKITFMQQASRIFYNICMLLICYLINKIELDYSLSQVRTKKQLHQENYLLAGEMHRWLTDPQLNKFGQNSDTFISVLNKKRSEERRVGKEC